MTRTPRLQSLQFRLTASIGLVVAIVVVLVGNYWVTREEQWLSSALQAHADTMAQMTARGLAEPIWNLDQPALNSTLDALMTDPQVAAVELSADGINSEAFRRQRDGAAAPAFWRDVPVAHVSRQGSVQQILGHARLGFSQAQMLAAVAQARVFVASMLAAVLLAVVICSYWLIGRLVHRPLSELGDLAGLVASGRLGATLTPKREDAIGRLTRQFNDMSLQLQRSANELQLIESRNRAELEALVRQRTLELEAAMVRAEQANQTKGRFLATVSHEFRTPLNAIMGFSQLLKDDDRLDLAMREQVGLIHQAGQHLLGLIEDLLDSASIDAGRLQLDLQPTVLPELLDAMVETLRIRAEAKGLQIALDLHQVPAVACLIDGQRLRQVLLNLMANAVKFTDQGRVRLVASGQPAAAGRGRVRLAVEDSGIGLSPQDQQRLFQRFEQLGDGSRRAGGTGLGLAISQDLVRLMGGSIEVDSQVGQGSRFWFELEFEFAAESAT